MPDLPIFEELVETTSPANHVRVVAARPLVGPQFDRSSDPHVLDVLGIPSADLVAPGLVASDPVGSLNERLMSLRAQRQGKR